MKLVKITTCSDPRIVRVPELYEEAYPIEERTETERLLRMIEDCPEMTFNAILDDNDAFAGMAVVWELGICRYLLYLAVLREKRNQGIGAAALTALKGESDVPIILEVELPSDELKRRRIGFYVRNGFHIETENPVILNAAHTYENCVLMLMADVRLADCNECQRRVVDTVYKGMHDYTKP